MTTKQCVGQMVFDQKVWSQKSLYLMVDTGHAFLLQRNGLLQLGLVLGVKLLEVLEGTKTGLLKGARASSVYNFVFVSKSIFYVSSSACHFINPY
jgi:hypothetical protein